MGEISKLNSQTWTGAETPGVDQAAGVSRTTGAGSAETHRAIPEPAAPAGEGGGAATRVGEHRLNGVIQQSRLGSQAGAPVSERFQQGVEQFRAREYGQARQTFRQLLDDPQTPASARPGIAYDLGQANMRLGNYREAAENFRSVADNPDAAPSERAAARRELRETHQAMLNEGLECHRRGDFEGARRRFQELRDEPGVSDQVRQAMDHNLQIASINRRADELMNDQLDQIVAD